MLAIDNVKHYGDTHHPVWMDIFRVALGSVLVYQGIFFLGNTEYLQGLMTSNNSTWMVLWLAHYVCFAHVIGGLFIIIGLLTRLSVVLQIPILIGAVFAVNLSEGMFNSELWLSLVVLGFLIVFLIYGSGKMSVDYRIK